MKRTARSIRQSLILATATGAVLVGLGAAMTPAAQADEVDCTDGTNTYWTPECDAYPASDDAGGVSGGIVMHYQLDGEPTGTSVLTEFDALGEQVRLANGTSQPFTVEVWVDGVHHDTLTVLQGADFWMDYDLDEGQQVWLRAEEPGEDNYAQISELVS